MKSTLPAYTRCPTVELAAALGTLGIEVKVDVSTDRMKGWQWRTLLVGLESVPYKHMGLKETTEKGEHEAPTHQTQMVMDLILKGNLQSVDPHHPALDVLRACRAADALETWIRTGQDHLLVKIKGADRYMLKPGQISPEVKTGPCLWGTRDRKLAATLCTLGYTIARLEPGTDGHVLFCFTGPHMNAALMPMLTVVDMAQAWRTQRLQETEPEHPLLWMMQGLSNRDAIGDLLKNSKPLVLIRAPGTGRASLVSSNAKGRTMDRVKRHLGIS